MLLSGIHIPQACISRIRLLDTRIRGYDNPNHTVMPERLYRASTYHEDCIRATGPWIPASAGMTTQTTLSCPNASIGHPLTTRPHPCNRPLDTRHRGYDNPNHTVMPECFYRASIYHRPAFRASGPWIPASAGMTTQTTLSCPNASIGHPHATGLHSVQQAPGYPPPRV